MATDYKSSARKAARLAQAHNMTRDDAIAQITAAVMNEFRSTRTHDEFERDMRSSVMRYHIDNAVESGIRAYDKLT